MWIAGEIFVRTTVIVARIFRHTWSHILVAIYAGLGKSIVSRVHLGPARAEITAPFLWIKQHETLCSALGRLTSNWFPNRMPPRAGGAREISIEPKPQQRTTLPFSATSCLIRRGAGLVTQRSTGLEKYSRHVKHLTKLMQKYPAPFFPHIARGLGSSPNHRALPINTIHIDRAWLHFLPWEGRRTEYSCPGDARIHYWICLLFWTAELPFSFPYNSTQEKGEISAKKRMLRLYQSGLLFSHVQILPSRRAWSGFFFSRRLSRKFTSKKNKEGWKRRRGGLRPLKVSNGPKQ
jgi:hypothetical protein